MWQEGLQVRHLPEFPRPTVAFTQERSMMVLPLAVLKSLEPLTLSPDATNGNQEPPQTPDQDCSRNARRDFLVRDVTLFSHSRHHHSRSCRAAGAWYGLVTKSIPTAVESCAKAGSHRRRAHQQPVSYHRAGFWVTTSVGFRRPSPGPTRSNWEDVDLLQANFGRSLCCSHGANVWCRKVSPGSGCRPRRLQRCLGLPPATRSNRPIVLPCLFFWSRGQRASDEQADEHAAVEARLDNLREVAARFAREV